MGAGAWVGRCGWVGVGLMACWAVQAEPRGFDAEPQAVDRGFDTVAAPRPSTLLLVLPRAVRAARADAEAERPRSKSFADLGVSVVELPAEGLPGTRSRPHHALSIASDMPRTMLRSIGIDATECSTRFRLPTKVQRDVYGGSRVDVRAQVGLACGF